MKPPKPLRPLKYNPTPCKGVEGEAETSCESKNGTVVWAASLPMSECVNLMNWLGFEIGSEGNFVLIGMWGHLRETSLLLSFPIEFSVLSFDIQKFFSGSIIWPVLKGWNCYKKLYIVFLQFTWSLSQKLSSQGSSGFQDVEVSLQSKKCKKTKLLSFWVK